jgi:hypothetical protein
MVGGVPYQVKTAGPDPLPSDFTFDNVSYSVKTTDLNTYRVSSTQHLGVNLALVDCGANSGIAGCDCGIVEVNDQPQHFVNVEGGGQSNRGPAILLMNQYTHSGKGHSIHSSPQWEWNEVNVDDKSTRVGGKQCLLTFDGFSIPINIRRGLPYIDMQPFTDTDF